jgi:hypothetical protein
MSTGNDSGHVIHLAVSVSDLEKAKEIAYRLIQAVSGVIPELEPGGTTVSPEGQQARRQWIICDRRMLVDQRCRLPYNHSGDCLPEWPDE